MDEKRTRESSLALWVNFLHFFFSLSLSLITHCITRFVVYCLENVFFIVKVSIQTSRSQHFCGGTWFRFENRTQILTAAHCVVDKKMELIDKSHVRFIIHQQKKNFQGKNRNKFHFYASCKWWEMIWPQYHLLARVVRCGKFAK